MPPPDDAQLPAIIEPATVSIPAPADTYIVPALVANAGDRAGWRYVEFFVAHINNPNTRRAYARACAGFFACARTAGSCSTAFGRSTSPRG